jgi:hypothetical protein
MATCVQYSSIISYIRHRCVISYCVCLIRSISHTRTSWVFFIFLSLRSNRLDFRHLFGFYVLELNLSSCLDLSFNSHLPVLFTYQLLYSVGWFHHDIDNPQLKGALLSHNPINRFLLFFSWISLGSFCFFCFHLSLKKDRNTEGYM